MNANRSDLGPRDFLQHILEASDRILVYTSGMNEEQFLGAPMVQDAVIRNVEIIGEATNNLLEAAPNISVRYPNIPFAQIYGMRNRVAHRILRCESGDGLGYGASRCSCTAAANRKSDGRVHRRLRLLFGID